MDNRYRILISALFGINTLLNRENTTCNIQIPIRQEGSGKTVYVLWGEDSYCPLPGDKKEEKYSFSIEGNTEITLEPITFHHAGLYNYRIESENEAAQYQITIEVKNANNNTLTAIMQLPVNEKGEKTEEIVFYGNDNFALSDSEFHLVNTADLTKN